ncbi:MAG: hypothetical protein R2795_10660 [Saprospiraceae bacterium]
MKKLTWILVIALAFVTTSCFDMLEDVRVNQDGSGVYSLTFDMSSMMSDAFMGEMMKSSLKEQMGRETLEMDSLLSFDALLEGSEVSLTQAEQRLLEKAEMRMQMSESKSLAKIVTSFPFASMDELNDFQETFEKINASGDPTGMGGMFGGGITSSTRFAMNGRTLSRTVDPGNATDMLESIDEETMDMMKMFMEDATFVATYYLPGKVSSSSIANSVVDGKTVTVSYKFLDILEKMPNTGGEIKFKKK